MSDLLSHFPDVRLREGRPERVHVHRIDLLDPNSTPVDGTLYLHPEPAGAWAALERWRPLYNLEQLCVLTPAGPAVHTSPPGRNTPTWLEFSAGEALPLDFSARLLRVLMEQPRGISEFEQLRDELVEELLTRPASQVADVLERALGFGLDLSGMTQVLVVGGRRPGRGRPPITDQMPIPSRQDIFLMTRRAVAEFNPRAQVFRAGAQVTVLFDNRTDPPELLAERLASHLQRAFPAHYVLAALGERVRDTAGLANSYRAARAALEVALERPQQTRWVSYDSMRHLLLYRELRRHPELTELIEGSLRPLLDLPGEYRRVLLETLAAYLEHNRSPGRAAAALGVHPNTLKYRMKRISELLDIQSVSGNQFVLYYLAAQLNM